MLVFLPFIVALQDLQTDQVRFKHVSAAYVLRLVNPSPDARLLGEKVTVHLEAGTNSLLLNGPRAQLEDAKRVLEEFDVLPVQVTLRVYIALPKMNRTWTAEATLYNNSDWTLVDPAASVNVTVRPRVNTDGTVSLNVTLGQGESRISTVAKVKSGGAVGFLSKEPWTQQDQFQILLKLKESASSIPIESRDMSDATGLKVAVSARINPK